MTNNQTFTVKVTETVVTTKTIILDECRDITDLLSAEIYVYEALQNIGFGDITDRPTVQEEYELTYNEKPEWEVELNQEEQEDE